MGCYPKYYFHGFDSSGLDMNREVRFRAVFSCFQLSQTDWDNSLDFDGRLPFRPAHGTIISTSKNVRGRKDMTYRKFSSFTEGLDTQKLKGKRGGGGMEDHDRSFLSFSGGP